MSRLDPPLPLLKSIAAGAGETLTTPHPIALWGEELFLDSREVDVVMSFPGHDFDTPPEISIGTEAQLVHPLRVPGDSQWTSVCATGYS